MTLLTMCTKSRCIALVTGLSLLVFILPTASLADIVPNQSECLLDQKPTITSMLEILEPESLMDQLSSDARVMRQSVEPQDVELTSTNPGLDSASRAAIPEPRLIVPAILVALFAWLNRRPRRRLATVG